MSSVGRMMAFHFFQLERFACAFCVVAGDYGGINVTEGLGLLLDEIMPGEIW